MLFDPKRDNIYYYSDSIVIVDAPDLGHPVMIFRKEKVSKGEVGRALDFCGMKLMEEVEYNGEKCFRVEKG